MGTLGRTCATAPRRGPLPKLLWADLFLLKKYDELIIVSQAFAVFRFMFHYLIPVMLFAYCYGRIFHTIRRQNKAVSRHQTRGRPVPATSTSRDQNTEQAQQQATGTGKLSRTEMNILQTMVAVIVCFLIFWSVSAFDNLFQVLGVSMSYSIT